MRGDSELKRITTKALSAIRSGEDTVWVLRDKMVGPPNRRVPSDSSEAMELMRIQKALDDQYDELIMLMADFLGVEEDDLEP